MNWLTSKVQAGDVDILLKLGAGAKLRDYIQTVYRKVRGKDRGIVAAEIPTGAGQFEWQARKLIGKGMMPSGKKMFTPTGRGFYRGLNIFPGGLRGRLKKASPIAISLQSNIISSDASKLPFFLENMG